MLDKGFIYILTNSVDAATVKVGRTNDLCRRLKEHNSASNVIGKWKLHWHLEVPDTKCAEALALKSLRRWQVPGRREQFRVAPNEAKEEVSVALAEWSNWGSEEKTRREQHKKQKEKELASKREADRKAREAEKLARDTEKCRQDKVMLIEALREFFPERKVEYERAKRIVARKEHIAYPWGYTDLYLGALLALSAFYAGTGTNPWEWARIFVFLAFVFGLFAFIVSWERFREWLREMKRQPSIIHEFENTYPDGVPPKSVEHIIGGEL